MTPLTVLQCVPRTYKTMAEWLLEKSCFNVALNRINLSLKIVNIRFVKFSVHRHFLKDPILKFILIEYIYLNSSVEATKIYSQICFPVRNKYLS